MRVELRRALGATLLVVAPLGCGNDPSAAASGSISDAEIDAHLRFLASDLLKGRRPGTREARLAADYIATQFELAGLSPPVGDTSYLQPVPLLAVEPEAELSFRAPGGAAYSPAQGADFVAWSSAVVEVLETGGDLVFVGHGTSPPAAGPDDGQDVDLAGDVLLMLAGEPVGASDAGEAAIRQGHPSHRMAEALRRGAAGVLLIPDTGSWTHDWEQVRSTWGTERLYVADGTDIDTILQGWLSRETAGRVLAMAGLEFSTLEETAASPEFRPIETGVRATASIRNGIRPVTAWNVAGLLPGREERLADEVVLFGSHFDHLGVGIPVNGDSIYNGAYDNASGTSILIAVARAFTRLPRRPARSVLFLAVTAEEPDGLGARYYTKHPLLPIDSTVAAIDIHGGNLWGITEDAVVLGREWSTLGTVAAAAANAEGLELAPAPRPVGRGADRPGLLAYVEAGIPAVSVSHGVEYIGEVAGWGLETLARYRRERHHLPGDEYGVGVDLGGAVQQARLAFRLGAMVAGAEGSPGWLRRPPVAAAKAGHSSDTVGTPRLARIEEFLALSTFGP